MVQEEQQPQFQEIVHPSTGEVLEFPIDMSDDAIKAAMDNYIIDQIPQDTPRPQMTKEYSWLEENLDFPAGIAGAVAGERLGAPFGPYGRITGAVVGGGVGTVAGVLASQSMTDEQLDYNKAVKEGLIGIGIDIATLGAGKLIPNSAWVSTMKRLGVPADVTAAKIAGRVDTPLAKQQTQEFLESRGLSLTPFQTGAARGAQVLSERIASIGIFSRSRMGDHFEAVQGAIRQEFDNMYDLKAQLGFTDIGSYVAGIIEAGKDGLSQYYGKTLDDIQTRIRPSYTSAAPLKAKINSLFDKYGIYGQKVNEETGELIASRVDTELTPEARSFLVQELGRFQDVVAIDAKSIIQLEKKITQMEKSLLEQGQKTAASDIVRIGEELKSTYADMLTNIDPVQGARYAELKNSYKKAITNLVPKVNRNITDRALRSGDYMSLGKTIIDNGSLSQIKHFMGTIDQAYALARKNGTLDSLPFKTPSQAKQQVRKSFLNNMFPDLMNKEQDLSKMLSTIRKYSYGDNEEKLKALFGPDYSNVRKLFNAIEHTAKNPSGDIGSLMFRNKEYSSLINVASLVTAGIGSKAMGMSMNEALMTMGGAAFVLYTPIVMSKIATDPRLANKLLGLTKGNFANREAQLKVAGIIMNDVIKLMDDGEQLEFIEMLEAMHHEGTHTGSVDLPQSALYGM